MLLKRLLVQEDVIKVVPAVVDWPALLFSPLFVRAPGQVPRIPRHLHHMAGVERTDYSPLILAANHLEGFFSEQIFQLITN